MMNEQEESSQVVSRLPSRVSYPAPVKVTIELSPEVILKLLLHAQHLEEMRKAPVMVSPLDGKPFPVFEVPKVLTYEYLANLAVEAGANVLAHPALHGDRQVFSVSALTGR